MTHGGNWDDEYPVDGDVPAADAGDGDDGAAVVEVGPGQPAAGAFEAESAPVMAGRGDVRVWCGYAVGTDGRTSWPPTKWATVYEAERLRDAARSIEMRAKGARALEFRLAVEQIAALPNIDLLDAAERVASMDGADRDRVVKAVADLGLPKDQSLLAALRAADMIQAASPEVPAVVLDSLVWLLPSADESVDGASLLDWLLSSEEAGLGLTGLIEQLDALDTDVTGRRPRSNLRSRQDRAGALRFRISLSASITSSSARTSSPGSGGARPPSRPSSRPSWKASTAASASEPSFPKIQSSPAESRASVDVALETPHSVENKGAGAAVDTPAPGSVADGAALSVESPALEKEVIAADSSATDALPADSLAVEPPAPSIGSSATARVDPVPAERPSRKRGEPEAKPRLSTAARTPYPSSYGGAGPRSNGASRTIEERLDGLETQVTRISGDLMTLAERVDRMEHGASARAWSDGDDPELSASAGLETTGLGIKSGLGLGSKATENRILSAAGIVFLAGLAIAGWQLLKGESPETPAASNRVGGAVAPADASPGTASAEMDRAAAAASTALPGEPIEAEAESTAQPAAAEADAADPAAGPGDTAVEPTVEGAAGALAAVDGTDGEEPAGAGAAMAVVDDGQEGADAGLGIDPAAVADAGTPDEVREQVAERFGVGMAATHRLTRMSKVFGYGDKKPFKVQKLPGADALVDECILSLAERKAYPNRLYAGYRPVLLSCAGEMRAVCDLLQCEPDQSCVTAASWVKPCEEEKK